MSSDTEFISQLKNVFHSLTELYLVEKFGSEEAESIFHQYLTSFEGYYEKNLSFMPDDLSKRHGINSVFVLAYTEALTSEELSIETLEEDIISIYRVMLKQMLEQQVASMEHSDNPWELFVTRSKTGNKQQYENDYFRAEIVQDDSICFAIDIHRCLYFEILEANGHPEYGPILCTFDHLIADAVNKWVTFDRKETIADGNKRCTFRYHPKKKY